MHTSLASCKIQPGIHYTEHPDMKKHNQRNTRNIGFYKCGAFVELGRSVCTICIWGILVVVVVSSK